jgi:hypothetical protein
VTPSCQDGARDLQLRGADPATHILLYHYQGISRDTVAFQQALDCLYDPPCFTIEGAS